MRRCCSHIPTKCIGGFSLIELLVVIAIIGILVSLTIGQINTSRDSALDVQRVTDMRNIRNALEVYYLENGYKYPGPSDGINPAGNFIGVGEPIDALLAPYMSEVPRDPKHDGVVHFYSYDPQHRVSLTNCGDGVGLSVTATVIAINKLETGPSDQRDTCVGPDMNIKDSDYNQALLPMAQ